MSRLYGGPGNLQPYRVGAEGVPLSLLCVSPPPPPRLLEAGLGYAAAGSYRLAVPAVKCQELCELAVDPSHH